MLFLPQPPGMTGMCTLSGLRVVLTCIFLMTNDGEYVSLYLLTILILTFKWAECLLPICKLSGDFVITVLYILWVGIIKQFAHNF